MSMHGDVTLDWADGTYTFRLALGQIRELEEKRGMGLGLPALYKRIFTGQWFVDDLRETIRLGLIGGGQVAPVPALKLVERYVDTRPYFESMSLALAIIGAILLSEEEGAKKKESESEKETSGPSDSTFTSSTATVQ